MTGGLSGLTWNGDEGIGQLHYPREDCAMAKDVKNEEEKKREEEKKILLAKMKKRAREVLTETPVMRVGDFAEALRSEFADECAKFQDNLRGRNRSGWENLVDWVKAELTSDGELSYAGRKERYMIYLPIAGSMWGSYIVGGDEVFFVGRAEARKVINALVKMFVQV